MESLPIRSVNLGTVRTEMHPQSARFWITSALCGKAHHYQRPPARPCLRMTSSVPSTMSSSRWIIQLNASRMPSAARGNWALIHDQAARCVGLGVPVTFIAVMMKSNYLRLAQVARVVSKRYQAPLRVNVYQAVRSDLYALSYKEYWQGFRALFAETDVIGIGEPLVRAMAGLPRGPADVSEHRASYAPRY